jgi:hypothetical protein
LNIYIVFVLDIGILNSRGDMEVWGILGWKRVMGLHGYVVMWLCGYMVKGIGIMNYEL